MKLLQEVHSALQQTLLREMKRSRSGGPVIISRSALCGLHGHLKCAQAASVEAHGGALDSPSPDTGLDNSAAETAEVNADICWNVAECGLEVLRSLSAQLRAASSSGGHDEEAPLISLAQTAAIRVLLEIVVFLGLVPYLDEPLAAVLSDRARWSLSPDVSRSPLATADARARLQHMSSLLADEICHEGVIGPLLAERHLEEIICALLQLVDGPLFGTARMMPSLDVRPKDIVLTHVTARLCFEHLPGLAREIDVLVAASRKHTPSKDTSWLACMRSNLSYLLSLRLMQPGGVASFIHVVLDAGGRSDDEDSHGRLGGRDVHERVLHAVRVITRVPEGIVRSQYYDRVAEQVIDFACTNRWSRLRLLRCRKTIRVEYSGTGVVNAPLSKCIGTWSGAGITGAAWRVLLRAL